MAEKSEETRVFFPPSLADAVALCGQLPDAVPFAGGTWLLRDQGSRYLNLPEAVISLHNIDELTRIGRTESRIDIGSTATIRKILTVGRNILPRIFFETLESIAPPGVRGLATLGGNVCVRERSMSSHPTLHIMDAKLEFRRLGGSRWIPATSVRTPEGVLLVEDGELLTRIRIPLENWNVQHFRRIGTGPLSGNGDFLVFSSLGRTGRGIIADLRFALGSNLQKIYRNRDLETQLVGRKLPLSSREISAFLEALRDDIGRTCPELSVFLRERGISLVGRLLSNLPTD